MTWRADGPDGNETVKIHDRIAPYVYGHGVDLGCGCWKLKVIKTRNYSCIGIDAGYSEEACREADVIADVSDLKMFANEQFDYVYSSHTLEDLPYPGAVLREWWRLIKTGGRLILYLPLTKQVAKEMGLPNWDDFYPNKGERGANPYHQRDFHPQEIRAIVEHLGGVLIDEEIRGENDEYSFLQVYTKLTNFPALKVETVAPKKKAIVIRYGAIGDIIQTTPVFRKLKEDGYHVTVNCSEQGKEILEHSPYVDEFAVQIKDYVKNEGVTSGPLVTYWKELSKRYDRFINLTGAVEETLLKTDTKVMHMMEELKKHHPELSDQNLFYNSILAIRKQVGDINYYDNHLEQAGYPDRGLNGELHFTEQEELMAMGFRDRYPGRFVIMWVLSGSSYHKRYPFFQQVAQDLIVRNPDVLLVSVGDPECSLIERSESNRYLPRSGRWKLRTSLVMTKYVDLVIGPETGILNASGCFDTPKITFLSHSSHENLCKYWKNDFCLTPKSDKAFCHPCHVLHYTHSVDQECHICKGTHTMLGEIPRDRKFAGMWTCPYEYTMPDKDGYGIPAPVCTTALTAELVSARINQVYELWKSGAVRNERIAQSWSTALAG